MFFFMEYKGAIDRADLATDPCAIKETAETEAYFFVEWLSGAEWYIIY